MSSPAPATAPPSQPTLKRSLTLWHLILYGIIVIQPVAPMSSYGIVSVTAHGHVVTAILLAMVGMVFTAFAYGRMARVYPSAGSAYTYVSREIHPGLGYLTGWSMAMDYILNPLICTILCSKLTLNFVPGVPYWIWALFFAGLFTGLNLLGVKTNARINEGLAAFMTAVIVWVLGAAIRYVMGLPAIPPGFFTRPFYDPATFQASAVLTGTSIAVLTYIGFDGISTLSEEVENPRRNVLLATVLTCLLTGFLASLQVYAAQLVWPETSYPDVDTAYVHVSGRMGGALLFGVVNATLLVATIGSGMASLLGAARLMYGMGRDNALPRSFFGQLTENGVPRNNVLLVGGISLFGALLVEFGLMSFQLGTELLNYGAFIAFMGVNAAAFIRYVIRDRDRSPGMILPPILGFAVCFVVWTMLRPTALKAGTIWLIVGLIYGLYVRSRTGKLSLGEMKD
jgi:amino acid transporter